MAVLAGYISARKCSRSSEKLFKQVEKKILTEFSTDWRTDWLTDWLTDAFRQAQLNNGWLYGLHSFTEKHRLVQRHVPFGTPPLLKCVHHECTFVSRNISFILSDYSFFSVSQLHDFKILEYTCNKIKSRVLSSVVVSYWTLLVLTLKVYISRVSSKYRYIYYCFSSFVWGAVCRV